MTKKIKKPSYFLYFTEIIRAVYETILGIIYVSNISKKSNKDGLVILVIPGLLSTDLSTIILRKYLNRIGHKAFGWKMGRNMGRLESIPILLQKLEQMHTEHKQPIILIGWSMGGIFARETAKIRPQYARKIITIGSPFANVNAPNHAKWVYDLINKGYEIDQEFINQIPFPAPVPTTAFYSKMDGMVPWQVCMELVEDAMHKNIEISSSHFGMGGNPNVLKVVGENLT